MVTVPRPPPMPEIQRIYDRYHSVGMSQKATYDAKQAKKAEEERKAGVPSKSVEEWGYRKRKGIRPPGRREVEVCRNAQGKFSKLHTPQELAVHFGLLTGANVPPPEK